MKKIVSFLTILALVFSLTVPVFAADGLVTYQNNAGDFVFEPGGLHSPTDLFPNFKGVMPGDTLSQSITVKNSADKKVKVKIYMRSLGAHEDSVDFLSQLTLKVQKSAENEMAYMFDAAANETAQLTDWVCLGTLYSGGEVNLDLTLSVPTSLSNEYQEEVGLLDWEFMVEEFPIEPGDPDYPQTGDRSMIWLWVSLMALSLIALLLLLFLRKKKEKTH